MTAQVSQLAPERPLSNGSTIPLLGDEVSCEPWVSGSPLVVRPVDPQLATDVDTVARWIDGLDRF